MELDETLEQAACRELLEETSVIAKRLIPVGVFSAGFFTSVSSALCIDLEVRRYVKDVLEQLLCSITDFTPLLPWNWATSHPTSIHQYRSDERQDRAEQK